MDMRFRWSAALAAAFLLLSGRPATAAGVDPELVAESVSEDGYYVDSGARYFRSDADLDSLREALEGSRTAGVLVLPAGTDAGSIISRLLRTPNRRGTYVALAGTSLQAASNNLSPRTVDRLLARARRSGPPKTEVLTFLDLLNPKPTRTKRPLLKGGNLDLPSAAPSPGGATTAPAAAGKADDGDGGDGLLYGIGGLVVLALGGGGYLLWRRRRNSAAAA